MPRLRAGKATARDEREKLLSVSRKSNGSSASGAGPIKSAAIVGSASVKAAMVTGIRSAPVPLHSTLTLPCAAKNVPKSQF